jgi:hypothetical protein
MKFSLSFLNHGSYQIYSRIVATYCKSVTAAIMLSELINRYEYHASHDELDSHPKYGDGWFYLTMDKCEERTCLSRKEQDHALKILKDHNFIESVCFGLPAKRYFRIKEKEILEVFGLSKKDSSLSKRDKLECPKGTNCYDQKGQTIYKNHIEEPYEEPNLTTSTTSTEQIVVDAVDKIENPKKEAAQAIQSYLANRISDWGHQWSIPFSTIESLMKKYGISYVSDQVHYMISQQQQSQRDERSSKKTKTKSIDKPEVYLRLSCEKNYAISENRKK